MTSRIVVVVILIASSSSWTLNSIKHDSQYTYRPFQRQAIAKINPFIRNETKSFNRDNCSAELAPYKVISNISIRDGPLYDVKELDRFKVIGDAFLGVVQRESLFDTVKLTMSLSPIDSVNKVLQIIEYQLIIFILVAFGVVSATIILVVYVIFWSMKLTGNLKEVNMQRIADSEGSTRTILSFLLLLFTLFVVFGCTIAWVANTHITNNVKEAENQISWAVEVTESYINQIQQQMDDLFLNQYKITYVTTLSTILNDSIHSASGDVYLELAQNISDTYNKSLLLAYSISDKQKAAFVSLNKLYEEEETVKKLIVYTDQIVKAKTCLSVLQKWCDQNAGKCDADKKPDEYILETVDPAKMFRDEMVNASKDAVDVADNGKIADEAKLGYLNGKYFHNGTYERDDISFFSSSPSFEATCNLLDRTTGRPLIVNNENNATLTTSITCNLANGCGVSGRNTSTRLYSGTCCMTIEPVVDAATEAAMKSSDTLSLECGHEKTVVKATDGTETVTWYYQSDYRGNYSRTISGTNCVKWSEVPFNQGVTFVQAASEADNVYLGLVYNDDPDIHHNYCRNPMTLGVLATKPEEVISRAWCVTGFNETALSYTWEFCDVPFCPEDTARAKAARAADTTNSNYSLPTCESLEEAIFGGAASKNKFTLWVATETARNEAYFALEESVKEMEAQYKVIGDLFADTNNAFDILKAQIVSSIASGSEASKFDNYRNVGTIVIVCFCMLSACLAVAGVCMGYCNLTDVAPHLRTSGCSLGGRLIKVSSYWAAIMAIINLYMATIFFLPGALFSLVCTDFRNNTLFKLFDDRILVDYSILGRAVLGNDSYYNMTFQRLYDGCKNGETLWVALTLNTNPDYQLADMIQVNETLDVNYTYDRLRDKKVSMDFTKYPIFPVALETPLLKWNASNATQLKWGVIKDNFKNSFLGASKTVLESDSNKQKNEFCDQFSPWASDVDSTVTGNTLQCRDNFTKTLKSECKDWIDDYDDMQARLTSMRTHVNIIADEWTKYGDTFMKELLEQYNYTNNKLMYTDPEELSRSIINKTYSYWQKVMWNEVGCYDWLVNDTMINNFTMCRPVYEIIESTMHYFCDYMVTTMTLAWMSQGLIGLILALHMLVANSLSNYFIKMEKRHPDDISNEEMIAAFK